MKRIDEYDVEWFEGELLRRLRDRVIAKRGVTEGEISAYDLWAGKYDYGGTDVDCSLLFGKARYQNILAEILTELYGEEGASGQITGVTLGTLGVTWPVRLVKRAQPKRRAKRRRRTTGEEEP